MKGEDRVFTPYCIRWLARWQGNTAEHQAGQQIGQQGSWAEAQ
jgi:hypothetical protein